MRNQTKKKRTKFEKEMDLQVQKRMAELYTDVDFRLQLEKEAEELKTIDDINNYQINAQSISRDELIK